MNPVSLVSSQEARDSFYPTPEALAREMLDRVDLTYVRSVLEPSAGKGDLAAALLEYCQTGRGRWRDNRLDIDLCEIDPYLRGICKERFSGNEEVRIVHDDFLTYRSYKAYQLILMNPPFAEGDKHLLRAIEMQRRWGGAIVCLLNAETIRNPYSVTRRLLVQQLNDLDAEIQYVDDAFSSDAERKAKVDVAIISIRIPQPEQEESDIWERMEKATAEDEIPDAELHALVAGDYIDQAIQLYRTEVAASIELYRQYKALSPYMTRTLDPSDDFNKRPILTLTVTDDNYVHGFDLPKYLRTVRLKYWRALFSNKRFVGRLTSKLQEEYHKTVERMAEYEFSAFNIKQVALDMRGRVTRGIEDAITELFEKLTAEHSWYPECSMNRHYFNGWATNKAHKIGAKCIIPTYGIFSSYSWHKEAFEVSTAYQVLSDIQKAFDYLDGGQTEEVDLLTRLQIACQEGRTRNIECKYFKVDLFKKGTTHIKFYPTSMPLVNRLNIYAAQKKNWLPPNYGRSTYADMTEQARAVVDSFHGDGSEGSGQAPYAKVLKQSAFYLADPTQGLPALTPGTL